MSNEHFTALVLAGDRGAGDPLLGAEDKPLKALIDVAGRPMIEHVLDTLKDSTFIDEIIICGEQEYLGHYGYECIPQSRTPAMSVVTALSTVESSKPVLLTTADHPLLSSHTLNDFLQVSAESPCDATVALAPATLVENAYPQSKRTKLQFKEGRYCGCNLFTLLNDSARGLPIYWQQIEGLRKEPLRMARELNWLVALSYITGQLKLQNAMDAIGKKTGTVIRPVMINDPSAAVDVDRTEDLELVRQIFKSQRLN